MRSNSWQQLQWLTEMRNRLRATLSGDANVERPNQQDALQELLNLKSMSSLGSFPGLDKAIQKLTALGPADTQCGTGIDNEQLSHSELAAASSRQEDFHYINGMRVEVESDGLDSSL